MSFTKFLCTDGNADVYIYAETAREAAQEYVDDGDWGDNDATSWVTVYVTPIDDDGEELEDEREDFTIFIKPDEPDCEGRKEHDWRSPYSVLGGLKENPGVMGNGGGVIIKEVCAHCGKYRITNTWAQNYETGEQGLESVEYEDADSDSTEWVESMRDDEDA